MKPETKVGIFFVVGMAILGVLSVYVKQPQPFLKGRVLKASFHSVAGIQKGDAVTLAGVDIGTVSGITVKKGAIEVALAVDPNAEVKADSVAAIKATSLLGQRFIEVSLGSPDAPPLEGDVLNSQEAADLDAVIASLRDAASSFDQNQKKTFDKVYAILQDNEENISKTFANLGDAGPKLSEALDSIQRVSTKLESGEGTLGKLLSDDTLYAKVDNIATNLQEASGSIKDTFGSAKETLQRIDTITAKVESGTGTMAKLLNDGRLYDDATKALTDVSTAANRVSSLTENMEKGEGTAGKLLKDPQLYDDARKTLKEVGDAAEGVQDVTPLIAFTSILLGGAF